jgi:hypothetical protein
VVSAGTGLSVAIPAGNDLAADAGPRADDATTEGIGALTSGLALAYVDITEDSALPADAVLTAPVPEPASPTVNLRAAQASTEEVTQARVPPGAPVPAGARHRSRWRGVGIGVLVLCVLASAGAVAGILTGMIKLPSGSPAGTLPSASVPVSAPVTPTSSSAPPSASGSPTPSPSLTIPSGLPAFPYAIVDPLTKATADWPGGTSSKYPASCIFGAAGLQASLKVTIKTASYYCTGPQIAFGDFRVTVTVTLDSVGSCASVWFRLHKMFGDALRICANQLQLGTHSGPLLVSPLNMPLEPALAIGVPIRLAVVASGTTFTVLRCATSVAGCDQPQQLGQVTNATVTSPGLITLGIFEPSKAESGKTYRATFSYLEIATATPPPTPPTPPAVQLSSPPAPQPSNS